MSSTAAVVSGDYSGLGRSRTEMAQEWGKVVNYILNSKVLKRFENLIVCFLNPNNNIDFSTDCIK